MSKAIPMSQIRDQWVEFMTTFDGRESAPAWREEFDKALEAHDREVRGE